MVGITVCCAAAISIADETVRLDTVDQLPDGLNEKIAAALDPHGATVVGKDGALCTIWLAKALPVKPDFKPGLMVKYPFTTGELAGAMRVESSEFTDFRGQPIQPGVYTLRYGQQPQDGNHVGTSPLSDFLLAIPAAADSNPAPIKMKTLFRQSSKAVGTNHPAIFSLLPAEEKTESPKIEHDESKEYWILHTTATGKAGDQTHPVPLRLVVIGNAEV
jgi:hypothetical protein